MKDGIDNDIGTKGPLESWTDIDWKSASRRVKNLRQRIYRATQEGKRNKVRSLMKLMLRSYSNLLLAVRRVTQENRGKKTAGIDKQIVLTPKGRMRLVHQMLEHKAWQVNPVKRVYIPKASGKRPLGIPTIKNRTAQAIVKNALEPSWEAQFEANSYGFRPGRSCHDAIEQCWLRLNRKSKCRWVLDADIKGAFDNISHCFILDAIGRLPGRELIKQWLKAGYVEQEVFNATATGVPQGGIISPLLANVALDGMEELSRKAGLGLIRYADDFVITAQTKEELLQFKPDLEAWLAKRGLMLHPEKTRIVHISDGFNFLGFNIRQYKGKCLFKPQKEKVLDFLRRLRKWLKGHRSVKPREVIAVLNPILRGWANYYRHASSKDTYAYVDYRLWRMLWNWCLRRHSNKSKSWVKQRYFASSHGRDWRFSATTKDSSGHTVDMAVMNITTIKIRRHVKVRGTASPDDPLLEEYWQNRKSKRWYSDQTVAALNECRLGLECSSRLRGNSHERFRGEGTAAM